MEKTAREFTAEDPTTAMLLKAYGKVLFEDNDIEACMCRFPCSPKASRTCADNKNITFHCIR
jgi:tartrate dehydratase beta subunit/fumarate hydratase class I family protein